MQKIEMKFITFRHIILVQLLLIGLLIVGQSSIGMAANNSLFDDMTKTTFSNDVRTHFIKTNAGNFTLYYNRFIKVDDGEHIYYYVSADSISAGKIIREKYFPPKSKIPALTYFEVWTKDDDIIGRDRLDDYFDPHP